MSLLEGGGECMHQLILNRKGGAKRKEGCKLATIISFSSLINKREKSCNVLLKLNFNILMGISSLIGSKKMK